VNLTTGAPSATFTYTPASTGVKTISVTNNGGLTDPSSLSYTASAPPLSFVDNFTEGSVVYLTAHVADTGHTWVQWQTGSAIAAQVVGGQAFQSSAGTPDYVSSYTPATADTEASIHVNKLAISGAPEVGMWLRATADAVNPRGYMGRFVEGTGFQFYRCDAGISYVQLGSNVAGTLTDTDILRFTISGTGATVTLTLYKNGVSVATATDNSGNRIVATGKVGFHLYHPSPPTGNYRLYQISSP
jgi:hypothetical protein